MSRYSERLRKEFNRGFDLGVSRERESTQASRRQVVSNIVESAALLAKANASLTYSLFKIMETLK